MSITRAVDNNLSRESQHPGILRENHENQKTCSVTSGTTLGGWPGRPTRGELVSCFRKLEKKHLSSGSGESLTLLLGSQKTCPVSKCLNIIDEAAETGYSPPTPDIPTPKVVVVII